MRTLKIFAAVLLFVFVAQGLNAQSIPKREMRAAWVATVWGLDWPSNTIPYTGSTYYINSQKNQIVALIESMQEANLNTIFFQVRSECDAMYQSSYEPWSSYLVATRGMDPGYDPLQFVIEECHQRGMELHAWLNPYRFESVAGKYEGMAGDYRQSHPEWVLEYPDKSDGSKNVAILDPGNPGVRAQITNIVEEIVTNYDVDGVVFDDYFYAYGGTPTSLDAYSQGLWKPQGMDLDDWRRSNVNQMVADCYNKIQEIKPYVTFGLSPFGIWSTDPAVAAAHDIVLPQGIVGLDAYKSIYCDPVAWLEEGTVDYISPQLYWPTTSTGQDYDVLGPWWSDLCNRFRKHLYVSHSISDLTTALAPSADSPLKSISADSLMLDLKGLSMLEYFSQPSMAELKASILPGEYGKQVQVNRNSDKNGAPGSVFFRAATFYRADFIDYLNTNEFAVQSLAPARSWKGVTPRALPSNLRIEGDLFMWNSSEEGIRFVVYAVPNAEVNNTGNFSTGANILGVSYQKSFDLSTYPDLSSTHTMAVSVLDRFGNEFPPVVMGQTPGQNQATVLAYPADEQEVFIPFAFSWSEVEGSELYIIEVSEDVEFTNSFYRREVTENEFLAANISMTIGNMYYWRVITRKPGVDDVVSQVRSFNLIEQPRPEILEPTNEAGNISLTPEIVWAQFGEGFSYDLQISLNSGFSSLVVQETNLSGLSYQIPQSVLMAYSTYYVRLMAHNQLTTSAWSETVSFSTVQTPPSVPVIISPVNESTVSGPDVTVKIADEPLAKSFTYLLSSSPTFPILSRTQKTVDAFEYEALFPGLSDGGYYVKVRSNYSSSSSTDYSSVVFFNIVTTAISQPNEDLLTLVCPTLLMADEVLVTYSIPADSRVKLSVCNLTGGQVMILDQQFRSKGEYSVLLPAGRLVKGLYFLTLQTDGEKKTVKLIR